MKKSAYIFLGIGILFILIFGWNITVATWTGISFVLLLNFAVLLLVMWWVSCATIPVLMGDAPYVPTDNVRMEKMIRLAKLMPKDKVVDLGSGDGRLVFAAAKEQIKEAIGYEIHPGLVWASRLRAEWRKATRVRFVRQSIWDAPLGDVTVVLVYQLPKAMEKLAVKFHKELPEGARIISHAFQLPGWTPVETDEKIRVYVKGISDKEIS